MGPEFVIPLLRWREVSRRRGWGRFWSGRRRLALRRPYFGEAAGLTQRRDSTVSAADDDHSGEHSQKR